MNEINLIPYSLKEKKQKIYIIRQYNAIGILILCILFSGVYFPSMKLTQLKTQEKVLLGKVNENKAAMEQNKIISSELASYNERAQLIDYFSKNRIIVSTRIMDIEKFIPRDIKLVSLNYTKEVTTITGSTNNYNSVGEFAANLQTSKKYKSAKIVGITGDGKQSPYNFSINIVY
jgi:type IV pilus assembly protein PilN